MLSRYKLYIGIVVVMLLGVGFITYHVYSYGYENGYSYGYSSDYVYTYIEGEYATNSMVTCVIDHISDNKVYAKGGGMKDEIE